MWAYVKSNQVVRLYSRPTALTINGLQYPANIFSSWTASALKDIGIYSYSTTGQGDTKYYTNSGPTYTIDNDAGTVVGTYTPTAKDLDGIKEIEVKAVKDIVASKLAPTDWMVIKANEVTGNTVPSVYATYRSGVRTKGNALETAVNGAANVDVIITLHTSTYHANGSINVLASMQDWPTDPDAEEV